jgi:acyl dehydratase
MIDPNKQLYFEDVEVGMDVPSLTKGPMTTAHIMRWSATMENWHKIHYDTPFAVNHDKLPGVLLNGSFKQQWLAQLLNKLSHAGQGLLNLLVCTAATKPKTYRGRRL